MLNIILLGAPGSGKGTQANLLSKDLNIPAISTGEILRKEVGLGSEIGKLAKRHMDLGNLVPDEVVVDIIKKRISEDDCLSGFILDGFPRNLSQAEILSKTLNGVEKEIGMVFNVEIDQEVLVKRIVGRFSCKQCSAVYNKFFKKLARDGVCDECQGDVFESRDDDNEVTIRKRLEVYEENTKKLVELYRKKDLIYSINGLQTIALVNKDINKVIEINNN